MNERCTSCFKQAAVLTANASGRLCTECLADQQTPLALRLIKNPAVLVALLVGFVPFALSAAINTHNTVNGVVVSDVFRDWPAIIGGLLALPSALALLAIGRSAQGARAALAGLVVLLGMVHLVRGFGLNRAQAFQFSFAQCTSETAAPCQRACEKGNAEACDTLGVALDNASGGLERDSAGALLAFEKACEGGLANGCRNASLVITSDRVEKDPARGYLFAKRGCELGDEKSCGSQGYALDHGVGIEEDPEAAYDAFEKACAADLAEGCFDQGVLASAGRGTTKDLGLAARLYDKSCTQGDMDGCNNAGAAWDDGLGVAQDFSKALALYSKACTGDVGRACTNLARMSAVGHGIEKDLAHAASLFEQACDAEDGAGCDELGVLATRGTGVSKDPERAAEFFERACDLKTLNGCVNLGIAYRDGLGVEADAHRALTLFEQACDGEYQLGCTLVGLEVLDADPARARPLLQAGCDDDDDDACDALKTLDRKKKKGRK